jgi:RNA polymerase sigma-70 factor, ECF subfamily
VPGAISSQPAAKNRTPFPGLSDDTLLRHVLQREPEALGALYDRYGPLVYMAAIALTNSPAAADTVVLDVFETIWRGAVSSTDEQTVQAWILQLTHHHVAPHLKRSLSVPPQERNDTAAPPQKKLRRGQSVPVAPVTQEDVARAVLTSSERTSIALSYYWCLSPDLLALLLGEPVERVKLYLREGLLKLHRAFEHGTNERTV